MGADSPDTWDGSGDDYIDGEGIRMKPIEPGCLALLRPTEFRKSGKTPAHIVHVIRRYGWDDIACDTCGALSARVWIVKTPYSENDAGCCECGLTRIDGGDPDAITETDKEKDHAYTC